MKKRNLILFGMIFLLLAVSLSASSVYAEDEEEEDEGGKELGTTAFAIFGVCCIYIVVYQIFILSRKLPKDERSEKTKKSIGDFHKLVRKPLSLLHYLAGTIAIVILWMHGLSLIGEDSTAVVYGVTTASLLTFFVVSGLIIKLMPGKSKVVLGLKKILRKIHTNLIFFLIVLAPHLIHVAIGGD